MSEEFNMSGYFSGPVPDYAMNLIGTGSVDASQVSSSFGKANDAISLVNQFDASFLKNIAYIFNFDAGGAYGVYLPGLDKAIKTKELQRILEQKGYEIKSEGGNFVAYPKDGEEIDNAQIQREIDRIYKDLEQKGGHVISVNTKKILNDAKMDAENLAPIVDGVWTKDQLWEKMAILHLGETIVHEATHAKGYSDEGEPTNQQKRFVNWLWEKINADFKRDASSKGFEVEQDLPRLDGTRMARSKNWYKVAQSYIPNSLKSNIPMGSDVKGRHMVPHLNNNWGLMAHRDTTAPIETRLSREFMHELPEGVVQEHQIINHQLELQRKPLDKPKSSHSMEMLLDKDRGLINPYLIYEELLDEDRPKPIMKPISPESSSKNKLLKISHDNRSLFGWYNNLEISDGNTLRGLSDRVMLWDDRDESFAEEESWIRSQPRYNPRDYSIKGFWYTFVEPRFRPQKWNEMVEDNANIHPAKRFASIDSNCYDFAINAIKMAIQKIINKQIKCTRIIMTKDFLDCSYDLFRKCENLIFPIDHEGISAFAAWLYDPNEITEDEIYCVENYFEDKEEVDPSILEKVMGLNSSQVIFDIIEDYDEISKGMGIHIIGSAARKLYRDEEDICYIEFSSEIPENSIKYGSMLAENLGVIAKFDPDSMTLRFNYMGILFIFNGGKKFDQICKYMKYCHLDYENCLIHDICNRDLTINMISYDMDNETFTDYLGVQDECIDTFFPIKYLMILKPDAVKCAINLHNELGLDLSDEIKSYILDNPDRCRNI